MLPVVNKSESVTAYMGFLGWGLVWVLLAFFFWSYFSVYMEGESKFTSLMVSFVRKF
jgi:hypothetical protein